MRIIHRVETPAQLPKRKRVAAYARVSSGKDAMLNSLSAQVSYFSSYIQKHRDWEYCGVYADTAFTGTKSERPEFQRMMQDCRAGKVDMVIAKSISRFARNTVILLETVRELKLLGVDVYFERENIHSMSGDGELMLTILASFAQEESLSVSENCKWRIRKRMEKGETVGFYGMYGYDYRNGEITVNTEQAAVVKQIFDWYISGLGITAIAARLNEQGIPAFMGGRWLPTRVSELLANEKLVGNSLLQKKYCADHLTKKQVRNKGEKPRYFAEGTHPAIIDSATFEAAQRLRQERARYYKAPNTSQNRYPFSGKIFCEKCGKNYRRKKAVGKFNWYCSTANREGKAACPAKQIPEDILLSISADVLGTPEFDEDTFNNNISQIKVPDDNRLAFIFCNGRIVYREWQHRSRRESWTDEMKQQARECTLRRGGGTI